MRTVIFSTILISCLFSCKKDDDIPETPYDVAVMTFTPKSYYPTYPGSYWKYRIVEKTYLKKTKGNDVTYELQSQDTSYTTSKVSDTYLPHSFITYSDSEGETYSDVAMVPFVDDEPVYGYSKIDFKNKPPFGYKSYKEYPFLSETVGFEFKDGWYDPRFAYTGANNIIYDKTVDENKDSLIIVYGDYGASVPEHKRPLNNWIYYYKNIGLKNHYVFNSDINDTTYYKELIEYHINN